jgi:polyhydroxyalkanoate synthesis regulator phasin
MTNQEIKAVQTLIARQERRTDALIALLVSKGKLTEDEVKAFREAVQDDGDSIEPSLLRIQAEWRSVLQGLDVRVPGERR